MGNESWYGVADEHIGQLDVAPEKIPNVSLRRALLGHEVFPNLNVRAIQHGSRGFPLLAQRNQAWHLRVVDDDNIGSAFFRLAQRPTLREPVSIRILGDPVYDLRLLFVGDTLLGKTDSLQDIVHVLCDPEDAGPRLRNVPGQVDAHDPSEAHQGVAHQGHAAALGSAAEESNLCLVLAQITRKVHG